MAKDKTAKSLDARIAAVLATNGEADRDALMALWQEAWDAIKMAETVIEAETPRLLDLSNDEPDKSRELIESSKLRIERLTKAILEIKPRVAALDQEAALEAWTAEAAVLRKEANDIYHETRKLYKPIVALLNDLFLKGRANATAFNDLKRRAPSGADTDFMPAFPYEDFWLKLQLPDWDNPHVTHPPRNRAPTDWEIMAANAIAQSSQVGMLSLGKVVTDEDKAEVARRAAKAEQDLKAEAERKRDAYYAAQKEAERRHRLGG